MKIAVVGATGLVGEVILKVLEERNFPVTKLIPVASEKSVGKSIDFKGEKIKVLGFEEAVGLKPNIALFSAGGEVSKEWAPKFAEKGTIVIDNSSAWRMDETKKLIIPEINAHLLNADDKIIANPNCSTIQLLMALSPLHKAYGIKRVVVSTYQSVTGTGIKAVRQLDAERKGQKVDSIYPWAIDLNCIPHCDEFLENGYTKEEMKLVNETRKILSDDNIGISATAVRVPVFGGHSESVNVELKNSFEMEDVLSLFNETEGLLLMDDVENNIYPMPRFAEGKDEVFIGRVRPDLSQANSLNLWIVADNLRKGAATNAVQIAEYIVENSISERA